MLSSEKLSPLREIENYVSVTLANIEIVTSELLFFKA